MKSLVIAEKPSVARDLCKAVGGKFAKHDEYFESDEYVITSAVGHIVELCMPEDYDKRDAFWRLANLPIIPEEFKLKPIEKTESKFKAVRKLMKRKDIETIINACDAGREGELIFSYVYKLVKVNKPVKRLWMQSMTNDSILNAWEKLRPGDQMKPLADAAKCRSESDWLVGLNATRALTCFNSRHGGFNITAAGRVQTTTLAILAQREAEIRAFKPTPYFEVHGTFGVEAGAYFGRWFDEGWKKDESAPLSKPERIWDRQTAEDIVNPHLCDRLAAETASKAAR